MESSSIRYTHVIEKTNRCVRGRDDVMMLSGLVRGAHSFGATRSGSPGRTGRYIKQYRDVTFLAFLFQHTRTIL